MREKFLEHRFSEEGQGILTDITAILDEYQVDEYDLSLRQLYYQLIARDVLPDSWTDRITDSKNSQGNYKRIGDLVNNARNAGLIDWDMIKDRNRETITNSHWTDPADIVLAAAQSFRIDKWENQPAHVEVMVEKDALSGVLIPVCRELDVRFTANKGYSSSTMLYETGKRIQQMIDYGKEVVIFYLGDHDPSGIDMSRDIKERLELYAGEKIQDERLALNYDQIQILNPPENPAKTTDSRYKAYMKQFGESSWELDAIEPRQLAQLVRNAVEGIQDFDLWEEAVQRENEMRVELRRFSDNYRNGKH